MSRFIAGLTGGIGSGKTAASDHFASLGIDVIDADVVAREVVQPGSTALQSIADYFGAEYIDDDGSLNRALLRRRIFSHKEDKDWLESLLHPLIATSIRRQLEDASSAYAILVSPLLLETEQHKLCNRILLIDSPEALQISRTMSRDNNPREQVESIIANQASRSTRQKQADDIISNDGTLKELFEKVELIHQSYMELSQQSLRSQ